MKMKYALWSGELKTCKIPRGVGMLNETNIGYLRWRLSSEQGVVFRTVSYNLD